MYTYNYSATFVCGLPATMAISSAIYTALARFNAISRKNYKHLTVTIGRNGELRYQLDSVIAIKRNNLLRCTQQFSKELSKETAMSSYVMPRRLLKQ